MTKIYESANVDQRYVIGVDFLLINFVLITFVLFNAQQTTGSAPVKGETVAKLKVAINGFGRIGRNFLRCWHGRKDSPLDVIVVNDSGGVKNVRELMSINLYSLI